MIAANILKLMTKSPSRTLYLTAGGHRMPTVNSKKKNQGKPPMLIRINELKELIRVAVLNEVDIEDVGDVCFAAGSTHVMKTCSIGGNKYYLKFSDESLFDGVNPSLQILVEYLAYKVYSLYPGVDIPNVELVYDRKGGKVGLATSAVAGKMALETIPAKELAGMLSAGVYVDIFLANWDVIGTGSGNVIADKGKATRIDPGGSLTFRAQGGRKGGKFGDKPGELKTMLDPSFGGAGRVYQHADLVKAGKTFASVPWSSIASTLSAASKEVAEELKSHGMNDLAAEWNGEAKLIAGTLKARHAEVMQHVEHVA